MKKIMTFAIVAFLLGGFSFTASAQKNIQVPGQSKVLSPAHWDQKIAEFDQAVDDCLDLFAQMQADEKVAAQCEKKFAEKMNDIETKKAYLDQNTNNFSKKQGALYKTICDKKLKKLYAK